MLDGFRYFWKFSDFDGADLALENDPERMEEFISTAFLFSP